MRRVQLYIRHQGSHHVAELFIAATVKHFNWLRQCIFVLFLVLKTSCSIFGPRSQAIYSNSDQADFNFNSRHLFDVGPKKRLCGCWNNSNKATGYLRYRRFRHFSCTQLNFFCSLELFLKPVVLFSDQLKTTHRYPSADKYPLYLQQIARISWFHVSIGKYASTPPGDWMNAGRMLSSHKLDLMLKSICHIVKSEFVSFFMKTVDPANIFQGFFLTADGWK